MSELEQHRLLESVALRDATLAAERLVTVTICPDGEVKSTRGDFVIDDEAARLIVDAFAQHKADIPVDWEHQTLGKEYAAPDGRAPASGWIKKLWREPGRGLRACVRWNGDARDMIRGGQYAYLSPVFMVRKADRKAVELHSVGLTNKPAIVGMEKVTASDRLAVNADAEPDAAESKPADDGQGELKALVSKLRELLGVEGNVVAVLQAAVKALENKGEDADAEKPVANMAQVLADVNAVATMVPPIPPEYQELVAANRAYEEREREREAEALVAKHTLRTGTNGLPIGVIDPNDAEAMAEALAFAKRDPQGFERVFSKLRPLPPQGSTTPPREEPGQRSRIIASARAEYRGDPSLAKATSEEALVSLRLQEKGLARLSEDEVREHDLVVAVNR